MRRLVIPYVIFFIFAVLSLNFFVSYADNQGMRTLKEDLNLSQNVHLKDLHWHMKKYGYSAIEEIISPHGGGAKGLCKDYGYFYFLFENENRKNDRIEISYSGKMTLKGCQIQITDITKKSD